MAPSIVRYAIMLIEHTATFPDCHGRIVTAANLTTKSVSAIVQLRCNTCRFVSSKRKLFREVSHRGKGRKCAEPNRSLALGLLNTSIFTAGVQRLLLSVNKTTPASYGLQKRMNSVGSAIQKLNVEDMAKQRRKLKDMLQHSGYIPDTPIPAEYNRQ